MKHALIFWPSEKTISVVKFALLKRRFNGNHASIRWHRQIVTGVIIAESENVEWLNRFEVNTDGIIIGFNENEADSDGIDVKKNLDDLHLAVDAGYGASCNQSPDRSKDDDVVLISDGIDAVKNSPGSAAINEEDKSIERDAVENDDINSINRTGLSVYDETNSRRVNIVQYCVTDVIGKEINSAANDFANIDSQDEDDESSGPYLTASSGEDDTVSNNNDDEKIELVSGSKIYVNALVLADIIERFENKPKEIIRRLLLHIIGRENLKKMTLKGRGNKEEIPPRISDAIEKFVLKMTPKEERLTKSKYKKCITKFLTNFRASKMTD